MNDAILPELKCVVERAVRPVRATLARKRRMREELLAHLAAIFEEEATRLGNEQAALEQAKQRFGDPRELTGQLQQAVPRWNRCRSILENMGCQPGESAWHLAAKHFLVTYVIYAVAALLWLSTILASGRQQELDWQLVEVQRMWAIGLVLGVPVVALYNVLISVILARFVNTFGSRLAATRRGRIFLALLCVFVAPCCVMLPPFAGAAVLFVAMAYQAVKQWRYQADWT